MDIAIYVADEAAQRTVAALLQSVGALPDGYSIHTVSLDGLPPEGIPTEVVKVMMRRRGEALPLILVDGQPTISGRLPTAYEILSLLPDDGTHPAVVTSTQSTVQFGAKSRMHISLNVRSLETSLPFYGVLFGAEPVKVKPFYAKFELAEPRINFTLNERTFEQPVKEGPVGHFGIQVKNSDAVLAAKARYQAAGFHVEEEVQTACCFAVQTKIWVADPDLNKWEVYVVTEPESEAGCGPDCICLICYKQMQASYVTSDEATAVAR